LNPRKLKYLRVNDGPPSERDDRAKKLPIEIINLTEWFDFCQKLSAQAPWDYELLTIDFNFKDDQSGPWFPLSDDEANDNDFRDDSDLRLLKWSDRLLDLGPNSGILIGVFLVAHAAHRDLPCGVAFHTRYATIVMQDMSSAMLTTQILLSSGAISIGQDLKSTMKKTIHTIKSSYSDPLDGLLLAVKRFRKVFLQRAGAKDGNETESVRLWMEPTSLWSLLDLFRSVQTEEELDDGLNDLGIEFHERNGALESLDVRSLFINCLWERDEWSAEQILPRLPLSTVKPAGEGQPEAGIIWQFVEELATRTPSNIAPVLDFFSQSSRGLETRSINEVIKRKTHRLIALIFAWLDLYAERWFDTQSRSWDPAINDMEGDFEPLTIQMKELLRLIDSMKNAGRKDPYSDFIPLTGPDSISSFLRAECEPGSALYRALRFGEARPRQDSQKSLPALLHLLTVAVRWGAMEELSNDDGTSAYRLKSVEVPAHRPMKTLQSDLAARLGFNVEEGRDPSKQLARIVQDAPGFEKVSVKDFLSSLEERPLPDHYKWLGWEFMDKFWRGSLRKLPLDAFPACLSNISTPSGDPDTLVDWSRDITASYDAIVRTHSILMPPRATFNVSNRLEIECFRRSAGKVGGDYYRIKPEPNELCRLYVGDVCGKGITARFTLQEILGWIPIFEDQKLSPEQTFTQLDEKLGARVSSYGQVQNAPELADRWATFICGDINLKSNQLTYSNAGHPAAILVRKEGACQLLESQSLGVGMIPGTRYFSQTENLSPGDRIVFYTDGLADKPTDKLLTSIRENRHSSAKDLMEVLLADFVGPGPMADDLTIVVAAIE
jgi:hypothetical protein